MPSRQPEPHADPAFRAPPRAPAAEREAAQRLVAAVARCNALLARSLDRDVTMLSALEATVPALAEWGVIQAPGEAGEADWCQSLHADEARAGSVDRLARFPFARLLPARESHGGAREPRLLLAAPGDLPAGLGVAEERAAWRELRPGSLAVLTLPAGRSAPGTLVLATAEGARRFGGEDGPLLAVLAEQVGFALHAARLFGRAERAWADPEERHAALVHELKNHLHAIGLALSLLSAPDVPEERRHVQLETIARAVRLMNERLGGAPPSGRATG